MLRKQKIFKSCACNFILQVFGICQGLKNKKRLKQFLPENAVICLELGPEDVKPGAEVQTYSHAFDWSDIGSNLHPTNKISKKGLCHKLKSSVTLSNAKN